MEGDRGESRDRAALLAEAERHRNAAQAAVFDADPETARLHERAARQLEEQAEMLEDSGQ